VRITTYWYLGPGIWYLTAALLAVPAPQLAQRTAARTRTAPLWGVGRRPLLLHGGGAQQLEDAIGVHDREAARARARFDALKPPDHAALLALLKSL
jgi:CxxC motif-containing protein (DUF1111 family)